MDTSRVFACMSRLYDLLHDETTFPWSSLTNEGPLVVLGGMVTEQSLEPVVIIGTPPEEPAIDFGTIGPVGNDEQFGLRVLVATLVPGQTGADALARLAELTATVETALRNQTTGKPIGGFDRNDPYNCGCLWWRVARIAPQLMLGPEGVIAQADIDIVFRTRI